MQQTNSRKLNVLGNFCCVQIRFQPRHNYFRWIFTFLIETFVIAHFFFCSLIIVVWWLLLHLLFQFMRKYCAICIFSHTLMFIKTANGSTWQDKGLIELITATPKRPVLEMLCKRDFESTVAAKLRWAKEGWNNIERERERENMFFLNRNSCEAAHFSNARQWGNTERFEVHLWKCFTWKKNLQQTHLLSPKWIHLVWLNVWKLVLLHFCYVCAHDSLWFARCKIKVVNEKSKEENKNPPTILHHSFWSDRLKWKWKCIKPN